MQFTVIVDGEVKILDSLHFNIDGVLNTIDYYDEKKNKVITVGSGEPSVKLLKHTGRFDMEGVEIKEGDVLSFISYDSPIFGLQILQDIEDDPYMGVIEYRDNLGIVVVNDSFDSPIEFNSIRFKKVIGNIHTTHKYSEDGEWKIEERKLVHENV